MYEGKHLDPETCQCKDIGGFLNGGKRPGKRAKQHLIVDLLPFYHECRPLIGYATHVLFRDRQ